MELRDGRKLPARALNDARDVLSLLDTPNPAAAALGARLLSAGNSPNLHPEAGDRDTNVLHEGRVSLDDRESAWSHRSVVRQSGYYVPSA